MCGKRNLFTSTVIAKRCFTEMVDDHWAIYEGYGFTGLPTLVSSGPKVVGAQPKEVYERLMTAVGAERHASKINDLFR